MAVLPPQIGIPTTIVSDPNTAKIMQNVKETGSPFYSGERLRRYDAPTGDCPKKRTPPKNAMSDRRSQLQEAMNQ